VAHADYPVLVILDRPAAFSTIAGWNMSLTGSAEDHRDGGAHDGGRVEDELGGHGNAFAYVDGL